MAKIVFDTLVHGFPFSRLSVTHIYGLTYYIVATLHKIEAKLSGSSDYRRLKEEFQQYSEVFDRNPSLLQTKELRNTVERLREKMKMLKHVVKTFVSYGNSTQQAAARQLLYIIKPHLKPHPASMGIIQVLAMGGKIAVDLQTVATTPLVAALELTDVVSEIDTLSHAGDAIYGERSNEIELRHLLGNATKRRHTMIKALETVLYSLLQALHSFASSAAERAEIDEIINHINGLLDSYRAYSGKLSRAHHHASGGV
jgi:Mg2+ and Co2+ transporter CorA